MDLEQFLKHPLRYYKRWAYHNTALFIASIALFIYIADSPIFSSLVSRITDLGYVGAYLAGIFFVSTFTVAPAAAVLLGFTEESSVIWVALAAGLGGEFI